MSKRVALITGVSRRLGIAAAVAFEMSRAGWRVGLTGWPDYDATMPWGENPNDLGIMLSQLESVNPLGVAYTEADLSDPDAPNRVFEETVASLGQIDALVNVHAYSTRNALLETSPAEFDKHMAVNARGTFLMCAEYARRWKGDYGTGRIVNFTGSLPLKGEAAYAASKGAIEWLTVAAASEFAMLGITVNAINPGPNDTGWMGERLRRQIAKDAPLGRAGTPEDVAKLVVFLCSPDSRWITGQILHCDGGWNRLRQ